MLDFIVFKKLLALESGKDQGKNICLFQRMPPAGVFVLTGFRISFAFLSQGNHLCEEGALR
jgi:hypothetical protein